MAAKKQASDAEARAVSGSRGIVDEPFLRRLAEAGQEDPIEGTGGGEKREESADCADNRSWGGRPISAPGAATMFFFFCEDQQPQQDGGWVAVFFSCGHPST